MFDFKINVIKNLPTDTKFAAKYVVDFLIDLLWPAMYRMKNTFHSVEVCCPILDKDDVDSLKGTFLLCGSQVVKITLLLVDIFKKEVVKGIVLQESRDCLIERLTWCLKRLMLVDNATVLLNRSLDSKSSDRDDLDTTNEQDLKVDLDTICNLEPGFVHWIDHIFECLVRFLDLVSDSSGTGIESVETKDTWINMIIDEITGLHSSIEQLLLSGMTLSKYCTPSDQLIISARSHVVLREAKVLIRELVDGDIDSEYKITKNTLRIPFNPSNIGVLIDVLKDTLYLLEGAVNTALLSLLLQCLARKEDVMQALVHHYNEGCKCDGEIDLNNSLDDPKNSKEDVDCKVISDFDFFSECFHHIAMFAMSSSSDDQRTLNLRSSLASLEALDPHLVPTVMISDNNDHKEFLVRNWRQEIEDIKRNIFLIVDPVAFIEKAKEMMKTQLVPLLASNSLHNDDIVGIINIGMTVHSFLQVYMDEEPDALNCASEIIPLLDDLKKVAKECKVTWSSVKTSDTLALNGNEQKASIDKIIKRLKLLFTIVKRIGDHNKTVSDNNSENDLNETGVSEQNEANNKCEIDNRTQILNKTKVMKVQMPVSEHPVRNSFMTNGTFSRTDNISRKQVSRCIISKLTNKFGALRESSRAGDTLSFSIQLEELFDNVSRYNGGVKHENDKKIVRNSKYSSILYDFPKRPDRLSLRKAVLKQSVGAKNEVFLKSHSEESSLKNNTRISISHLGDSSNVDASMSLQITDILNQLVDLSTTVPINVTQSKKFCNKPLTQTTDFTNKNNVLKLRVNDTSVTPKYKWSISINQEEVIDESVGNLMCINEKQNEVECQNADSTVDIYSENTMGSSAVLTPERINDLEVLEKKLAMLKNTDV